MFDAGASAETLGDLTAHIPDTRAAACAAAAAAAGCGALAEKVDYLVSCFSSPSAAGGAPLVVAGTQAGALGVFPVVRDRLELPGRTRWARLWRRSRGGTRTSSARLCRAPRR